MKMQNLVIYYQNSSLIINTALIAHHIVKINQASLKLAVVHIEWLIRSCPKSNPNVNCSFLTRVAKFTFISATGFHDNMLNQQNLCSWLFSLFSALPIIHHQKSKKNTVKNGGKQRKKKPHRKIAKIGCTAQRRWDENLLNSRFW